MRTDSPELRSLWLLGALLWALAIWAATLLGLGSRPPAHPVDGAMSAALPVLPATAPAALGAYDQYPEIAARPLFTEDRRAHPFFLGKAPGGAVGNVRLTGVLITPGLEMATLTTEQGQSLRLRLGAEPVAGWQLLALQPRGATVSGPAGTQTLELALFNGLGGEAPTPLLNVSAGGAPPPAALPMPPAAVPAGAGVMLPAVEDGVSPPAQIQSIRERIQARRRQLEQDSNGQRANQSK